MVRTIGCIGRDTSESVVSVVYIFGKGRENWGCRRRWVIGRIGVGRMIV